jgi:rhodanese-related sulfurtransferase
LCITVYIASAEDKTPVGGADNYCGIYAMHAVLKLAGTDILGTELLKPRYLDTKTGSSLKALQQLALDYDLNAACFRNLSLADLRHSNHLMILNVKSKISSSDYDHYYLFLGVEGDEALLFDPPSPMFRIPLSDLLAQWNGAALVVGKEPINQSEVTLHSRIEFYTVLGGLVAAIAFLWVIQAVVPRYRAVGVRNNGGFWRQLSANTIVCLGLISFAAFLSYWQHCKQGMLLNSNHIVDRIQEAHFAKWAPQLSAVELRGLLREEPSLILIDARLPTDFQKGHIGEAINIPPYSTVEECKKAVGEKDREQLIVVYCQSKSCLYAESVIVMLRSAGFSRVEYFKGGWMEWHDEA